MSTALSHHQPRHRKRSSRSRTLRLERPTAPLRARPRLRRRGVTVTPADRARLLRRFADVVDEHLEELAQLEVANSGHTISNARWEAGNVRDVSPTTPERPNVTAVVRSPSRAASTSRSTNRSASWASSCTVELPHADRRLGSRARSRGGQHRRLEARDADAAHGDAPRRTRARGRDSRGCLPGRGRRRRDSGLPLRHARSGAQSLLHRLERMGRKIMAGCAEQVKRVTLELGGKSANIIFADADLEKRGGQRTVRRLRQRGPGLLRAISDPRRGVGLRPLHGTLRAGGQERARPRTRPTSTSEMGPLITAQQRDERRLLRRRDRRSPSVAALRAGLATGTPRRCSRLPTERTAPSPKRSSAPSCRWFAFETRPRRSPSPMTAPTDCRDRFGRGIRRAGAARGARRRDRRTLGEFELIGALLDALRRLQAVRHRPRARSGRAARFQRRKERVYFNGGM
jgi:hypothetical protein